MGVWEWLNGTDTQQQVNRGDFWHAQDKLTKVSNRDRRESDDYLFWNNKTAEAGKRMDFLGWFLGD